MNNFYGYLKKDTILLVKRKKYLYISIILPIVLTLIFLMILSPSKSAIKVAVCDFDSTIQTQQIMENMQGFEPVFLKKENCIETLKKGILMQKYPLGIEIGKGFSENIENLKQSHITVYYDNTDIAFSNLISWKIDQSTEYFEKQIIESINKNLKENLKEARVGVNILKKIPSTYFEEEIKNVDKNLKKVEELETEFIVNPIWTNFSPIYENKTAKDIGIAFVFPIIALFIILMLSSTSILYDKKTKFLIRVKSSGSTINYLFAKIIFFLTLTIFQFALTLILFLIFGAKLNISILGILNLLLFISVLNTILGLIIGLVSDNEGIAILFSLMICFPLMLLSGIFTPLQTMPNFIQNLSKILPLSYQINFSKTALIFGNSFTFKWIYFCIPLFILIYILFKKKIQ